MKKALFLSLAAVALLLSSCAVNLNGVTANYNRMYTYINAANANDVANMV